MTGPAELTLQLTPQNRCDAIDLKALLRARLGEAVGAYRRAIYCSHHTTAGFLDRHVGGRLRSQADLLDFIGAFQRLFPAQADYEHDKLHLRVELSAEQRATEPRNADSHLTFIGAGMSNCLTADLEDDRPVYLVDLDGVHEHGARRRQASVVAYNRQRPVATVELEVPVSGHPIDSINVFEPGLGLSEQLAEFVRRQGVEKGRLDLSLPEDERDASLTVNEYETLLMQNDLRDVLRDPLRFMREKGRGLLRDPRAVAHRTLDYAQYDFVQVLNELMDAVGASESILERLLARLMALPAARLFGVRRSVSLLVSDREGDGGSIVKGTYQSPILMQWRKAEGGRRRVAATLVRFR
ncbi:MAG: hypothetical protein OES32_14450 [Acidobacteriota bacterium]|nr:hypothetical protein [Acidobacteriota bacterium]MDH3524781.1 hypothetical protein [Acidobacteriota bacterium]